MKKSQYAFTILSLCMVISACTHQSFEKTSIGPYFFNPLKTTINWTAYKYSNKIGVSGYLPDVVYAPIINRVEEQENIKSIFTNFQFASTPDFIKDDNPSLRNQNLQTYFFNKLNSKNISGKIISFEGTDDEGIMNIELIFNGVKKITHATYIITNNTIEIYCTLNMADYDASTALSTLHDQVADLHKGSDGITISWPDVDIKVVSILDRE